MKKLLLLLITSQLLTAITLTPMTETLTSKKQKNIIFKVFNTSPEPVAVNFSVKKVLDTDNNKEKREATTVVKAYPTQFILNPKETKSVRVRYMNSRLPDIEEVYRIIAQELDIDVSEHKKEETNGGAIKTQIKMRFSYQGLLFVHKQNAKENLSIKTFIKTSEGIDIKVNNSGNASAIPFENKYNFIVTVKGKEYILEINDLKGAEFRRVLAGKTNTFHLKNITSVPINNIESMRIEKK